MFVDGWNNDKMTVVGNAYGNVSCNHESSRNIERELFDYDNEIEFFISGGDSNNDFAVFINEYTVLNNALGSGYTGKNKTEIGALILKLTEYPREMINCAKDMPSFNK